MPNFSRDNPLSPTIVAAAVSAGQIQVRGPSGKWYDVRPNGALKRWKTDPKRFTQPCKVGFSGTFSITQADIVDDFSFRDGLRWKPDE